MSAHSSKLVSAFANAWRTFVPVAIVLLFVSHTSAQQTTGNGQTPLDSAKDVFERQRSDEHRTRVSLQWSDENDEPLSTSFEIVFMNIGYLEDTFLLLQFSNGVSKASIAKSEKYLESVDYFTANITTEELLRLRRTIGYLMTLRVEETPPHVSDESRYSLKISSHGSDHLVMWREGDGSGWKSRPSLRSENLIDGIRDLDEMKTSAIMSLVWERFSPEVWITDSDRLAQENWRSYWREMLPEIRDPSESHLLIESACDMLSDIGDANDAVLLRELASRMRNKEESIDFLPTVTSAWRIENLKKLIALSTTRIMLRQDWDSQKALHAIRISDHRFNVDLNQAKWLRKLYHEKDPLGYHESLIDDLKNRRSDLVETSIRELAIHYSGEHREDFHRLLKHADSDVVFASAMAIAGRVDKRLSQEDTNSFCVQAARDPLIRDALAALERLASDTSISIRPEVLGFFDHARNLAIDFLTYCPAPWAWDTDRCQRQLENPKEVDGRVIESLLIELQLPRLRQPFETPVELSKRDRNRLISAWRRCLAGPYNHGTVLAIDELIAFKDFESLSTLRQVVAELQSGCAPNESNSIKNDIVFQWLTQFDVDEMKARISELAASAKIP